MSGLLPTNSVIMKDGRPVTTSLKVSEIFGKQHKDVLKSIKLLDCSEEFGRRNFAQSSYINEQNKQQPMIEMVRDGFVFLAMGFTGPKAATFKEAYIAEFNRMEAQQLGLPKNYPAALRNLASMALALANEWEQRQAAEQELARCRARQAAKPQALLPEIPFLTAWWDCLGSREITAMDLHRIIASKQCQVLLDTAVDLFGPVENWTGRRLGNALRTWSNRTVDGFFVLNKGKGKGGIIWRLERTQ